MGDERRGSRESRREPRARVYYMAQLLAHDEISRVKLLDVSPLGALIEGEVPLFAPDEVVLIREGLRIPCRVVWSAGKRAGLEFTGSYDPDELAEKLAPRRLGK